jgi:hypothetical protein
MAPTAGKVGTGADLLERDGHQEYGASVNDWPWRSLTLARLRDDVTCVG